MRNTRAGIAGTPAAEVKTGVGAHLVAHLATGIGAGFRTYTQKALAQKALGLVAGLLLALQVLPAGAQSFTPVARVDGEVITRFELDQRQRFLTLLRAPGDVRAVALDQLVSERLQNREVERAGIELTDEQISAGIEEFAKRGNLTGEQFLTLLAQKGIAAESFRDFVAAGVGWREFVKAKFSPLVTLSQTEIEIAMGESEPEAGLRVLLSEIALPAGDPATRRASMKRANRLTGLDEAGFRDAATRFSVARSRAEGGEMPWVDASTLPPVIAGPVRALRPGQTTRPIQTGDKIRVYFMRDREQVKGGKRPTVVDYAALLLPGGASEANLAAAAKIRADITDCDGLYPVARGLPPEQLIREELRETAVPAPFRAELATLDPGEISTRVTTANGALAVLMLCARGNELPRSTTEEAVAIQLKNSRMSSMARSFLDELKADARIEILR